jgi:membrane protease YdiL (CAAX protease family)
MYLALLLQLLPAMALAQVPLVDQGEPLPRIPVYLSSVVLILGIGILGVWIGRADPGLEKMGLAAIPLAALLTWTLGLSGLALLILMVFYWLRRLAGIRESAILGELLPRRRAEKWLFVILSCSAGFGEEVAYRGFLIPILANLLGWEWMAVLLSSTVFGLLHAYQTWLGVVRTGALGLLLAGSFILSGTLWPAILAHAILDVVAGIFLGETLLKE